MYLTALAGHCERAWGVRPLTGLLDGAVVTAIAAYVRDRGIDIVVMATHGRGGISRVWIGSVAEALVRSIDVPVLLVRPAAGAAAPRALQRQHILIPLDGSALAEHALEPAIEFCRLIDARITLLHVLLPMARTPALGYVPQFADSEARREREEVRQYLERVAAGLRGAASSVDVDICVHMSAAQGILHYAGSHAVDTIMMATIARRGWKRIALGSVADRVMRSTMLPLVLYHPRARAARQLA